MDGLCEPNIESRAKKKFKKFHELPPHDPPSHQLLQTPHFSATQGQPFHWPSHPQPQAFVMSLHQITINTSNKRILTNPRQTPDIQQFFNHLLADNTHSYCHLLTISKLHDLGDERTHIYENQQ